MRNGVKEVFDYIILDCPPSLGLITTNALAASNSVIIPVQCEFFALEGIMQLLNSIMMAQKKLNPTLDIEGVLLTMLDSRTNLGFEVHSSGFSDRHTYQQGQYSIPSDTVCYPAKLVHGHIEKLIKEKYDAIFYPCMSYNFDEKMGDNHFNCPIVAYYPENITNNVEAIN